MREALRRHGVTLAVVATAALALGPALRPGYVLQGDQVFVPDQSLLPWMVGLGGGLPRSVPQDAVVAVLTGPLPGWLWQTVALLGALVLLGTGVARLLRPAGRGAQLVGATVAVWSPYVAERLLLGHWSLLLAVAALPWALVAADDLRRGRPRAGARWLLWTGLASLTVSGGLLVLVASGPVALWSGARRSARATVVVVGGLVLQGPWLVPALLHPTAPTVTGADVFALRPEGPWGPLLTALATGGAWNADAVPASRATVLGPALVLALLALAWVGRRDVAATVGRPVAATLAVTGTAGLLVAVASALPWASGTVAWVVGSVPGAGVLRDAQKWLAPWLLLLALASALGARRTALAVRRRTRDRSTGTVLLVAAALLPLAMLPDLAFGALGRLAPVQYPEDWARVRQVLADDPRAGDVVSLPWSTFRRFDWNLGRTVLDPAPRALPRTVVADGSLAVRRGDVVVVVPGDDPRAAAAGAALASGTDAGRRMRELGIGWAVVAAVPGAVPLPADARLVVDGTDLDLYRLGDPDPWPVPDGMAAVLAADLAAVGLLLGAAVVAAARRRRSAGSAPGRLPAGKVR